MEAYYNIITIHIYIHVTHPRIPRDDFARYIDVASGITPGYPRMHVTWYSNIIQKVQDMHPSPMITDKEKTIMSIVVLVLVV